MSKTLELITIGKGTYGEVYRLGKTNEVIKRIEIDKKSGIHFTTMREIRILSKLRHKNIVKMSEIFIKDYSINIVLEYMPFDLSGLIRTQFMFTDHHINSITWQLLSALEYIHDNKYIYRDLKPGNILLDKEGNVKITDFGMMKQINHEMSNKVCSLWYRAPELLLGSDQYSQKIDCWSLGCILLEIRYKNPIFKGKNEIDQVKVISELIGSPSKKYIWSELFNLQENHEENFWSKYAKFTTSEILPICKELLRLDENLRITAKNGLKMMNLYDFNMKYEINAEDVHDLAVEYQY